ncbi:hypothetical protein DYB32_009983, partial [Aphanomyces invadans]
KKSATFSRPNSIDDVEDWAAHLGQHTSPTKLHSLTQAQPVLTGAVLNSAPTSDLAKELRASRAIVRYMACLIPPRPLDDDTLRSYIISRRGEEFCQPDMRPTDLLNAICTCDHDYRARFAIAGIDLFLSTQAREIYDHDGFLNQCLNSPVRRWPICSLITDASLLGIISSKTAEPLLHHSIEEDYTLLFVNYDFQGYDYDDCYDRTTDGLRFDIPWSYSHSGDDHDDQDEDFDSHL